MQKRTKIGHKINGSLIGVCFLSNAPILLMMMYAYLHTREQGALVFSLMTLFVMISIVLGFMIHLQPMPNFQMNRTRIKIMIGGRNLIVAAYGAFVLNSVLFLILNKMDISISSQMEGTPLFLSVLFNYLFGIGVVILYYSNGWIRIVATSRRIDPVVRLIIVLTAYLPVFHLISSVYLMRKAITEYQHEWDKYMIDHTRIESKICETKYPLLMLHGVGFRDLKYINYWGRIPRELIKNGATVYYGHQEAWGTIESNAVEIKNKIHEILNKEKTDKVNIIAHSKGGLDARYVVSQLNMGDYVASVTTISSPHHGSEVIEFVEKLPTKLVDLIGKGINRYFKWIGDKSPNFQVARKQFLMSSTQIFNEKVKDHPTVYYQSYGSIMKTAFSDPLLFFPYCIVRIMGSPNDGLVSTTSARWGDFKGIIRNNHWRGISHGDIIDLKREDYPGFDVREFYVQMVSELKGRGF